jgi:hypothetical protein
MAFMTFPIPIAGKLAKPAAGATQNLWKSERTMNNTIPVSNFKHGPTAKKGAVAELGQTLRRT